METTEVEDGKYVLSRRETQVAAEIVDCAYRVHVELGAGLYEHIYEVCLCHELRKCGLEVQRQVEVPLTYDGILFEEAFRLDILVENLLICEIKATESLSPVHKAQLLTYLRLTDKNVGFLINFNTDLMKHGIRRLTRKPKSG